MKIEFEIENIIEVGDTNKVYILAKLLNTRLDWKLTDESAIGQVQIEKWCDSPRAINNDGDLRLDLFSFVLKNNDDKTKLKVNQIAELIP